MKRFLIGLVILIVIFVALAIFYPFGLMGVISKSYELGYGFYHFTLLKEEPPTQKMINDLGVSNENPTPIVSLVEMSIHYELTSQEATQLANHNGSPVINACLVNAKNNYIESWVQTCGSRNNEYKQCILPSDVAQPINNVYISAKSKCLNP